MNTNTKKILFNELLTTFSELPAEFEDQIVLYQEYMMMYSCALKEVVTKFEILNDELKVRHQRSPIEFIQSRVKRPKSILEKIQRKGYEPSLEFFDQINDIAGVRIICSFIDDIYEVVSMFLKQDDITLIQCKDYIKNPKENGYRSYHLVVEVPVFFSDVKTPLKVEVQVRTIAMDFWASLEHQLKYKKGLSHAGELTNRLKDSADRISVLDVQMQGIRKDIEQHNKIYSQNEK
ncbi:MAG: GTP pyrophosphokinase family protein [Lachnospiraceae bacterium]